MYRSIVSVLTLMLMFGAIAPVSAQVAVDPTGAPITGEVVPIEPVGALECFDYYTFGSVQADLQTNLAQTVPGVTLNFSGDITNANSYPLVDGKLSVKIFKQDETTFADGDGNLVVDQFVIQEDIMLPANGSIDASFDWTVPRYAEGGEYYAAYFFTTSERYNLMGLSFTDDVVGNQAHFSVLAEDDTKIAKLSKTDTTINGQNHNFAAYPLQFEKDEVVTISTTVTNPTDEEKSMPLQWNQYAWDSQNNDNLRNTKTELVTLAANETKTVTYTPKPQREGIVYVTATTQDIDAKSILNIRYVRRGVEETRINFPSVTNFPLVAGTENTLFSCAHSTNLPVVEGNTLTLTLTDVEGNTIHSYQYEGSITGDMAGFGDTFTPERDYNQVTLNAKLVRNGVTVEDVNIYYDCNEIDPNSCLALGGGDINSSNIFGDKVLVYFGGIIILLVLLLILYMHRKKPELIAALVITFVGLGLSVGDVEAKSVTVTSAPTVELAYYGTGIQSTGQAWTRGVRNPNVSVTYNADVYNNDTNTLITDGSTVSIGTNLRFEPKVHSGTDISWFGTGYSNDSPNGYWNAGAGLSGPVTCQGSDSVGSFFADLDFSIYQIYAPLSVNPPTNTLDLSGGTATLTNVGGNVYRVDTAGTIQADFDFSSTYGKFYYRYQTPAVNGGACTGDNTAMRNSNNSCGNFVASCTGLCIGTTNYSGVCAVGSSDYQLPIAAAAITYNFTVPPAIITSPSCTWNYVNSAFDFTSLTCADVHQNDCNTLTPPVSQTDDGQPATAGGPFACKLGCNIPASAPWNGSVDAMVKSGCFGSGTAPTLPTITGPTAGTDGSTYNFDLQSTDPDGDTIYYQIDWNNDNVVDALLPNSGYINSGTIQTANRSWSTTGSKTFKVRATDDIGASSAWASHTIVISSVAPPPSTCGPMGSSYVWNGSSWAASGPTAGWNWSVTSLGDNPTQAPPPVAVAQLNDKGFGVAQTVLAGGAIGSSYDCGVSAPPPPPPPSSCTYNVVETCVNGICAPGFNYVSQPGLVPPANSGSFEIDVTVGSVSQTYTEMCSGSVIAAIYGQTPAPPADGPVEVFCGSSSNHSLNGVNFSTDISGVRQPDAYYSLGVNQVTGTVLGCTDTTPLSGSSAVLTVDGVGGPISTTSTAVLDIAWTSTGASSCTLAGDGIPGLMSVAPSGNTSVNASSILSSPSNYILSCDNGQNDQVVVSVTNTAPNPPTINVVTTGDTSVPYVFDINGIDPDNDSIYYEIDWDMDGVTDATTVTVASGVTQSASYTWLTPGTYTFQAKTVDVPGSSPSSWTTRGVTVVAGAPAPVANLSVRVNGGSWGTTNQTVNPGDIVELSWTSTDATTCTGTNFNTSNATSNGSLTVTTPAPNTTTSFDISCTGPGGTDTTSINVTSTGLPNFTAPIISPTYSNFDMTTGLYQSVSFVVSASNNGFTDIPAGASYRLELDYGNDGSIDSVTNGTLSTAVAGGSPGTDTASVNNVPFGVIRVIVTADNTSSVTEGNESDNSATYTLNAPLVDPGIQLNVDRIQVRNNDVVTLSWDTVATFPMNCSVVGPGVGPINFDPSATGATGSSPSGPITAKSEFVLTCVEPTTNTSFIDSVVVETIGEIQET